MLTALLHIKVKVLITLVRNVRSKQNSFKVCCNIVIVCSCLDHKELFKCGVGIHNLISGDWMHWHLFLNVNITVESLPVS